MSSLLQQPTTCTSPRTLTGQLNTGIISQEEYNIIALQQARERWRQCRRRWHAAHEMHRPDLFFVGGAA